ncbi:TolB-like 6-blade propeller-like [Algoriphagus locisalis]|uniref:TolB-like 6-blade propeller-like n=1 Tax=Algoriphagus locisalis TaxID=305507 RepID=A0A1I7A0P0_9BACT|nr:BF3164 family lipoprotein [Algoriphagus locisalis]SFT68457.1 TolB-like 6-blade propeller-like [Algoriphagus locisalis]
MRSILSTLPIFAFSIILLAFSACEQNVSDGAIYFTEEDLPQAIDLVGEKYNIPEIVNPRGLMIKDDFAVVFERKKEYDDKFHIIDLESGSYIGSKGIHGLGPGETTTITQIEDAGEEDKVWAYNPEVRKFSKYDLLDTNKLAEEEFRSPETEFFITYATWANDQTLLANLVDGWTKYLHLTTTGDTLSTFGDWKDMIRGKELPNGYKEEDLDANLVSTIFRGTLKGDPSKKYFVNAGKKADFIEIIDLVNKSSKIIYGPTQDFPEFKISYSVGYQMADFGRNSTTRYMDVYPGNESFYVLFNGKTYKEISEADNLNRIFEFDYDGNILNQYQLDYPLFGIAVDEESRAIYGVTIDREPNLVRFDY